MALHLNFIQVYSLKVIKTKFFPSLYMKVIWNWKNHLALMIEITSFILSQYLWYNESIHVDEASVHSLQFPEILSVMFCNFLVTMYSLNKWHKFKRQYSLPENSFFQWLQLINSFPERWKFIIKENYENATNIIIDDHHLIKSSRAVTLDKLTSTKTYSILTSKVQNKLSYSFYFKNLLNNYGTDWAAIYISPCLITYNTCILYFQYKILNNIVFLIKNL